MEEKSDMPKVTDLLSGKAKLKAKQGVICHGALLRGTSSWPHDHDCNLHKEMVHIF